MRNVMIDRPNTGEPSPTGITMNPFTFDRLSDWLGPLYQTANRLAHLHFLREHAKSPDAWLVNILFENDPTYRPTSRAEWDEALKAVAGGLGLPHPVIGTGHVFVPGIAEPKGWPGPKG